MCGAAKDQLDNWWESMKKHYFIGFLPFRGQTPEHSEDVLHGSNMDKYLKMPFIFPDKKAW